MAAPRPQGSSWIRSQGYQALEQWPVRGEGQRFTSALRAESGSTADVREFKNSKRGIFDRQEPNDQRNASLAFNGLAPNGTFEQRILSPGLYGLGFSSNATSWSCADPRPVIEQVDAIVPGEIGA
jgi:hypothetical protein